MSMYEDLAEAVMSSEYETVRNLHSKGADCNERCISFLRGITPLMAATLNNDIPMIELLVSLGVNLDEDEFYHGNSALLFGAGQGSYEACVKLIELGADVTFVNRYSMTATDVIDERLNSQTDTAMVEMKAMLEQMPEIKKQFQVEVLSEETKTLLLKTRTLFELKKKAHR